MCLWAPVESMVDDENDNGGDDDLQESLTVQDGYKFRLKLFDFEGSVAVTNVPGPSSWHFPKNEEDGGVR